MARTGKLELTWVGKDERPRLEPRVLVKEPARSYGDPATENMLIFGDNLLALKALEQDFAGKIKCICIDPPYNTGAAFMHYDDGLEHSTWLTLMRDRLEILRNLLSEEGSLWVTIDDNEAHYLKVLCDEVFGRRNFVATVIWQKLHARNNSAKFFSADHDFILVYSRDNEKWNRNKLGRTSASDADFWNPDNDLRGDWRRSDLTAAKPYAEGKYEVVGPQGAKFSPRANRWWSISRSTFDELVADNKIWWGKSGRTFPFRKRFRAELGDLVPTTIWLHEDVGNNREAKQEITRVFGRDDIFSTPKPERLMERIVHIASNPGDWVLDSFGGSGTTGAVAHKMGRRWIMVELGEHCHTHIIPRMQKVVDGTDQGGISQSVGWKGGGGFKYYRLAESLLVRDKDLSTKDHPVYVINPRYDGKMLIRAICKIENFRYRNDGRLHGVSSENRFLHVTTSLLTQGYLDSLAEDIGPDQSLMVYCSRRVRDLRLPENIEIKRIPRDLLDKCDFVEEKGGRG